MQKAETSFTLLTAIPIDVDCWEGYLDPTGARIFWCVALGAHQGGVDDGSLEILVVVRCPRANIVEKVRAERGWIVSNDGSRPSDSYIGRLNLGVSVVVECGDHLRGLFVAKHEAPYPVLAISKLRELSIQLCVALSSFSESVIPNI